MNRHLPNSSRPGWKQDPDRVKADILRAGREEFAANGFAGGRIDAIAVKTKTSKRMIYYYFGDKAGLYRKVLEDAYRDIRHGEQALDVDHLPPETALRELVEFTFDHNTRNPDVIRLIMIENIHHGEYLAGSDVIKDLNRTAVETLARVYKRGCHDGIFRPGITALQLHWQISALCFFNVSNQATFSLIFGDRFTSSAGRKALRSSIVEMVMRYVAKAPDDRM